MKEFSRREFFKRVIPHHEGRTETVSSAEENSSSAEQPVMSRRTFIKFMGAMGAALALEPVGVKGVEAQDIPRQEAKDANIKNKKDGAPLHAKKEPISEAIQEPEQEIIEEGENSYIETAIEQSLLVAANRLAMVIFEKLKIEYSNRTFKPGELAKLLKEKPVEEMLKTGVLGPVLEEGFFRLLPSVLISEKDRRHRWDIGIPTSVPFALVHNLHEDEFKQTKLAKSIPITQFMGGLFYWYLMREKGYSHAVLGHSMNNTYYVGKLLFKLYPGKAEEVKRKILGIEEEEKTSEENLTPEQKAAA